MKVTNGIYPTSEVPLKILSSSLGSNSNFDTFKYVFLDKLSDGKFRVIPCVEIRSIPSNKQIIDAIYSTEFGWILIIDGEIQLASSDESLYHKALVKRGIQSITSEFCYRRSPNVLILGGGDGCAVREILSQLDTVNCIVIDHDPSVIREFREGHLGLVFNTSKCLSDPSVSIIFQDYLEYLKTLPINAAQEIDLVIIDLTDNWASTIASVSKTIELLFGTANDKIRVCAQLGPSRTNFGELLRTKISEMDVVLLQYWEEYIPSYGENWSFGLFGR